MTKKLSLLHSNSRNKYVNSRKYHNAGHMRCMTIFLTNFDVSRSKIRSILTDLDITKSRGPNKFPPVLFQKTAVEMSTTLNKLFKNVKRLRTLPRCWKDATIVPVYKKGDKQLVKNYRRLPVTWLNTIWLNFFVESFGLKILSQVTTKLSQLHSNSRNKYVNSRKYHNVGHMRCMHARPHRRKDQLPLRSLRDLRSR